MKKTIFIEEYCTYQNQKNILTHWSLAQAGLNDVKKWKSKIQLECPFNMVVKHGSLHLFTKEWVDHPQAVGWVTSPHIPAPTMVPVRFPDNAAVKLNFRPPDHRIVIYDAL